MVVATSLLVAVACNSTSGSDDARASGGAPVAVASGTRPPRSTTTRVSSPDKKPTTSRTKNAKPYAEQLRASIDDIQQYWADEMPAVYRKAYEKIPDERLYAATAKSPAPACAANAKGAGTYDDIRGNAFYCSVGKFVAWDDQELFPDLYEHFGAYAITMVLAHEWGHAVQDQVGTIAGSRTILLEQQADCFAGAWTNHAIGEHNSAINITPDDLQSAIGGLLAFGDSPGTDVRDAAAHGNGFDRINAFQEGYEQGARRCAKYPETPPEIVNLPFCDPANPAMNKTERDACQADIANGGNLAYDEAVDLYTSDLNAYWVDLGRREGFTFHPVDNIVRFTKDTEMPRCGSKQYTEDEALGSIFFCVHDNYVAWDDDFLHDVVNDPIGDFGTGVLLAKQWAVSHEVQQGHTAEQVASKQDSLQQSCYAGAWARAVLEGDKHHLVNGQGQLGLSPGDLDEAIKAFLAFSEPPDANGDSATGTAFEQTTAFRDGFFKREQQCDDATATAPQPPGTPAR